MGTAHSLKGAACCERTGGDADSEWSKELTCGVNFTECWSRAPSRGLIGGQQQRRQGRRPTAPAGDRKVPQAARAPLEPLSHFVTVETLHEAWRGLAEWRVHGLHTDGQSQGAERKRCYLAGRPAMLPGLVISCQKGFKGDANRSPNQDNFSVTRFKDSEGGYTLAGVFDGHGVCGHLVASRVAQTVPYFFALSPALEDGDVQAALAEAFQRAHHDAVLAALEQGWDIQLSGTTAAAAVWRGDRVWVANVGDSRCVVGTAKHGTPLFASRDHTPELAEERRRIEAAGGAVRNIAYADGRVTGRVFVQGRNFPGLSMTRALGDEVVKKNGVVATPDTYELVLDPGDKPFIYLATDGIWDFLTSDRVVEAVAKGLVSRGAEEAVLALHCDARELWFGEDADYCDDITSVLIPLSVGGVLHKSLRRDVRSFWPGRAVGA